MISARSAGSVAAPAGATPAVAAKRPPASARQRAASACSARRQKAGGLFAATAGVAPAGAATLPADRAEIMLHSYDGGGVKATGPALLVRKSLAERVSLSAQYYVDMVSNASIDVVTTASPYKETRTAYELGAEFVVRDASLALALSSSREPDYVANAASLDVSQEVFGGMSTVSLGFTRAADDVGQRSLMRYFDRATHWQYRVGLTQILSPRWLTSANFELVSDSGYLGSPYRVARVFGAAVPERNPRTRTSRALKLRSIADTGALVSRSSVRAEYRYFWDTWDIRAHTWEFGASRYVGERWLLDASLRAYSQGKALFYSDNATAETLYVSRNRQLSTFKATALSARATYSVGNAPAGYEIKVSGAWEYKRFRFSDFTDLRSGQPYAHNASVLQLVVSVNY